MKNLILFSAIYFFFSQDIFSQPFYGRCASFEAEKAMDVRYPGYLNAVKTAFLNAKSNAGFNYAQRAGGIDTIYKIRTVFHIVYTKPEENVDDSIIYSQLKVMNEDYRRLNADTSKTRGIFKSFVADAGIEFFLADTDPDGNATTGITRTVGNPQGGFFGGFSITDDVKKSATGGVDPWPTDQYLNIWVCDLMGGLGVLGYSYPPAVPLANWGAQNPNADSVNQGVVLYYKAVGNNNPYAIDSTVDGGRSAVHEVGHFLGLRHIWGDDGGFLGMPGYKCAGDVDGGDDGIDDTPDAMDASQQTCDTTLNTCTDPNMDQDYPDMIENYMDYSSDDCLNMFTHGQVALMREVLRLYRPGLVEKVAVDNTVSSIGKTLEKAAVKVSPNPARESFYVDIASIGTEHHPTALKLFTIDGKIMRNVNTTSRYTKINTEDLQAGVYLLSIQSKDFSTIKRVVIAN